MTLAWWLVLILSTALIYALVVLSFERRRSGESHPGLDRYYAGLRALVRQEHEAAFSHFKQAVSEDSQNIDAYLRIGDLLRERGQAKKALSIHLDLAQRAGLGKEESQAVRRALADDYLALGATDDALKLLQELADERDSAGWANRRLHRLHLQRQDFEAAYKVREKLIKAGEPRDPKLEALYLALAGLKASDRGEHRRGRVFLRDALKVDPACTAALFYLGEFYARDQRPEDAVRAWKNFLEQMPALAALVFGRLERVLFETGQYAEIAGVYQQVLAADSLNTDALLGLARFAEKKGDDQGAVEFLTRIVDIDPGHLVARQKLVSLYRQAGRTHEAWQAVDGFLTWLPARPGQFACRKCSYQAREPIWFCPQCASFDSFDLGPRRQASEIGAPVV
jgi:lipopolysaccharide biosynthesis regulator YciM